MDVTGKTITTTSDNILGSAADFYSAGDVNISGTDQFNLSDNFFSGNFTFECVMKWFPRGSMFSQGEIVPILIYENADGSARPFEFGMFADRRIFISLSDGVNSVFPSSNAIVGPNRVWSHVAVVRTGTLYRFFFDGYPAGDYDTAITMETQPNLAPGVSRVWKIGSSQTGAGYYNGIFERISVRNYAYTQQEIVDLANAVRSKRKMVYGTNATILLVNDQTAPIDAGSPMPYTASSAYVSSTGITSSFFDNAGTGERMYVGSSQKIQWLRLTFLSSSQSLEMSRWNTNWNQLLYSTAGTSNWGNIVWTSGTNNEIVHALQEDSFVKLSETAGAATTASYLGGTSANYPLDAIFAGGADSTPRRNLAAALAGKYWVEIPYSWFSGAPVGTKIYGVEVSPNDPPTWALEMSSSAHNATDIGPYVAPQYTRAPV